MVTKNMNKQILLVVGGVALLAVLYNIFVNKSGFPCNCPECQEAAVIDAINQEGAAFPQLGEEQKGAPAFVKVLYSILILFVIAGLLALATRVSQKGAKNLRKRVGRLPYGKRFR